MKRRVDSARAALFEITVESQFGHAPGSCVRGWQQFFRYRSLSPVSVHAVAQYFAHKELATAPHWIMVHPASRKGPTSNNRHVEVYGNRHLTATGVSDHRVSQTCAPFHIHEICCKFVVCLCSPDLCLNPSVRPTALPSHGYQHCLHISTG
jgi:hypothetical protein